MSGAGATALTSTFVHSFEKRMKSIQEEEYARSLLAPNTWWTRVLKERNIDGASERLSWFLQTAEIRAAQQGGNISFQELVTLQTELVPQIYDSAIRVRRDQLLDLRGGGLDILAEWSSQIGSASAYFPQKLAAEAILNGAATDGSAAAYDGVPFFADNNTSTSFGGTNVTGHPYNPFRPAVGGYVNWLHGSSGTMAGPNGSTVTYPGALPIDTSVSTDTAFNNLQTAIAYVRSWKMPNGVTPRFLRPAAIIVPPNLVARASQLLDAKFLAQAGGSSGAGSGDVSMIIQRWGIDRAPIEAQEFASTTKYNTTILQAAQSATGQASGVQSAYPVTITGNDTSWYLVLEQSMTSMLGSLVRVVREPWRVNYFSGESDTGGTGLDAILNRAREIEYIGQMREAVQYGHPYGLLRIDAT